MRLTTRRLAPGLLRRRLKPRRVVADLEAPRRLEVSPRLRPGLRFSERMVGHLCPPGTAAIQPCAHEVDADARLTLTFTVIVDDLADLLARPEHAATLVGTVECPELSPDGPLVLTEGTFNLFRVDPDRVERRTLDYAGTLTALDRQTFAFNGVKDVYNHPKVSDAWMDTSTLHVTVGDRTGVARLSGSDFLRQLTTMTVTNAGSLVERWDTMSEFVRFFSGVVRDMYGRLFARGHLITADAPFRPPPPAACPRRRPAYIPVTTLDGVQIGLTRYRGGPLGPVILAPGFGMTSRCFDTDTIPRNLVEHLCAARYDVWLLDYRSSPALGVSGTPFTIDDIARRDWPAAIDAVVKATGAPKVQVVAHCVGALSLLMGLAAEEGLAGKVRSAVCSQLGLHPISKGFNHVKAGLPLALFLRTLGWEALTAHFDEQRWSDWFIDKGLRLYPSHERCNNPVCRRVLFLFGESYKHDRLTAVTHDAIRDLFGWTSLRALQHLALMLRRGMAVNRYGEDVYESQIDKLAEIPLSFLHGDDNRQFNPESTEKTERVLREKIPNGPHVRQTFRDFGHLDCLIGRNPEPIFNWILSQLDNPPGQ